MRIPLNDDGGLAIPMLDLRDAYLGVVASALVVHLIYKKYEVQPSSYLPTFVLLVAIPALSSALLIPHYGSMLAAYKIGFPVFYASVLTSIAAYRLSPFHPLSRYPGPMFAKLSQFYFMWVIRKGQQHHFISDLHKKHGNIIRIGPNALSIADVDLLPALTAPDMPRGPMWDGRRNPAHEPHLLATRSSTDHATKRQPWAHALSATAVRDYQPAIVRRTGQLSENLERAALAGETVNIYKHMTHFAFDFMGDMAFGGGFELMRDGDVNGLWQMMMDRIDVIAWQQHIAWATRMLLKVPYATDTVVKFRNFGFQCAKQRKERGSDTNTRDLMYHLANEDDPSKGDVPVEKIMANGELAIVAGSDTTSTTLGATIYYLLTNPSAMARLRAEVDEVFPLGSGIPTDQGRLNEMKYLNAVIHEAMRLCPAVPTGIQRAPEKGTGGKRIGDHFLSEGTSVAIPPYVLQRDPSNFSPAAEEFWPERWLLAAAQAKHRPFLSEKASSTKQKQVDIITLGKEIGIDMSKTPFAHAPLVHKTAAHIPFSTGHANCVGKNLALAEMRCVLATLIQRFEFRFAPGYDPARWEGEMIDLFVFKPSQLLVNVTLRK